MPLTRMFETKHYFLRIFKVVCSCFLDPFFLMLAFGFVGFVFVFFFTSSCCCFLFQVSMFWLLFVLLLVSWVLLCVIFWISFFWGLGPSEVARALLICFLLFLVCFVSFCFVFWFCVSWFGLQGLRVRWGCPKGDLTWPQTLLISSSWFCSVFFSFLIVLCLLF